MNSSLTTHPARGLGNPIAVCVLAIYLIGCALTFHAWVEPSLQGTSDWRIGADSLTYMDIARTLTGDRSLITFTENLFGPVMLALWLKEAWLIALFNVGLFLSSLFLLRPVRLYVVLFWLFINPLTFPSLLTLNKEIFALFCAAVFWRWMVTRRARWLVAAVGVSAIVRWEQAAVILAFVLMLRIRKRGLAVVALLLLVTVGIYFTHRSLDSDEWGIQSAVTQALTSLQNHGLYFAVFPFKLIVSLTSQIVQWWVLVEPRRLHDLQTGLFVLGNQLSMCAILIWAWRKKVLRLANDAVYFMVVYAVIYCAAPLNQPRYFFFCYVLAAFLLASKPGAASQAMLSTSETREMPV